MDLKFDLHTTKYDAYRKLVRFVAMDGAVRVKCAVTLEALARAEGKSVADKTSPALFRKHADEMHQIAARKYRANQFDSLDRIVILPSDLDMSRWQSANRPKQQVPRASADVESSAA